MFMVAGHGTFDTVLKTVLGECDLHSSRLIDGKLLIYAPVVRPKVTDIQYVCLDVKLS